MREARTKYGPFGRARKGKGDPRGDNLVKNPWGRSVRPWGRRRPFPLVRSFQSWNGGVGADVRGGRRKLAAEAVRPARDATAGRHVTPVTAGQHVNPSVGWERGPLRGLRGVNLYKKSIRRRRVRHSTALLSEPDTWCTSQSEFGVGCGVAPGASWRKGTQKLLFLGNFPGPV